MHELSLAMALVEQLQEILAQEKVSKPLAVTVAIGALSGVDHEALSFCYPLVTAGTSLEGVALQVEEVRLRVRCQDCGRESQPEEVYLLNCGACASARVEVVAGREFTLRALEVA
ncbi:MAG: hydrogenase maturation nickel metallochaperone HypA [Magnetococcales bacterium]|nr:hydrogenase maturation nickel metallochaperone HypA [Magnetococcales bacterium]